MKPRFTAVVVRGLLILAEQAQAEEGRTNPQRTKKVQADRDRALKYLVDTAAHREIEWTLPEAAAPPEVDPPAPTAAPLVADLPEAGSVWEVKGGTVRFLVREVKHVHGAQPPVTATLRLPGGTPKVVTPEKWKSMVGGLQRVERPAS